MPRKTRNPPSASRRPDLASMRPRPDAAENGEGGGRRRAGRRASMRPRPDAAENGRPIGEAAARLQASMRPRPDAAENVVTLQWKALHGWCFNEAAARCRGKHLLGVIRA